MKSSYKILSISDRTTFLGEDAHIGLDDADLEFIRVNPEFWMGIRGFGVRRQIRAIGGQRNLCNGMNLGEIRGHGRPAVHETSGSSITCIPVCHYQGSGPSCKGKSWGPHAIHICDFDT